jgi:glucose dehydrogenase
MKLKHTVLPTMLTALVAGSVFAQDTVEWLTLGSDYAHTRYSPANKIDASNFEELEEAWVWDGSSFDAQSGRATPSYVDGKLVFVAGPRRHVIVADAGTGETLCSYREPNTFRYEYSMRKDYGKGVAIAELDGKKVIYITSPAFFLTALDLNSCSPLEGFGGQIPVAGFPPTGVVDLLADLGHPYDPYDGIPLETGYITSSSPPIVVNGTVVVGNSAEQGYHQSRVENIPGDILAYDARTGAFKWKFNVIPRPGEYGHETWENDAWEWTGDVSSWAPLSADQDLNLVYVPTNGATVDFYGGFRPGDNLFSTSLIALNASTGERAWHFQMVHHDIWNYDTPTAPILLDVTIDGRKVPAVAQATKQANLYAFNRETGEPLWPIVEREVPVSKIPGEKLARTQPIPTKPAPYEMQEVTLDELVDFTPELRQQAIEVLSKYDYGPFFQPPLHRDNDEGKLGAMWCPGDVGGTNINGPAAADPTSGIVYVTSVKNCSSRTMVPGEEADTQYELPTGTTFADYAVGRGGGGPRHPAGIPLFKPPYSKITAIDLNTGEHLWYIPVGETPDRYKNNPALQGIDIGNTGTGSHAVMAVTDTMLLYASQMSDGTPALFAVDKQTGKQIGKVELSDTARYGMMTYVHQGHQFILLQAGPKLISMALPGWDEFNHSNTH